MYDNTAIAQRMRKDGFLSTAGNGQEAEYDPDDYRTHPPFLEYAEIVRKKLSNKPMTIAELNRKLDKKAIPKWTMDALDMVADRHPNPVQDRFTRAI